MDLIDMAKYFSNTYITKLVYHCNSEVLLNVFSLNRNVC